MNISKARSCDGKVRHATKTAAKAARNELAGRIQARTGDLDIYRCFHCASWHVGHQPRRGQR